ncbi:MAG: hypothetical protein LQ338_008280 [Usnochroma carphineum]|nr:MAG: hypothetical protein LQ338_008280 [Usnochroma carphineum]
MQSVVEYSSIAESWTSLRAGTKEKSKPKILIAVPCVFAVIFLALVIYALSHGASLKRECSAIRTELATTKESLSTTNQKLSLQAPDTNMIATIIEGRPLANLVPLILAFAAVLGPRWPIRIFHTAENAVLLQKSSYVQRMIDNGQADLQMLPPDANFTTHEPVSAFFATPWLWEHLAPATQIFMFQADSMLCANSPRKVDEFLEYDFIGAPFNTDEGFNYNGGLSIRNREKMLDIARRYTRVPMSRYEDTWFVEKLRQLPAKPNGEPGANLPSLETASQFSVETIWKEKPFGFHQISRWHPEKLEELKAWCPESQLAIGGALHPDHKAGWATLDFEADTGPDLRGTRVR